MKGRDILIVEDENIVALDMRMRLETMGYRIIDVVDTGEMAVDRATALNPDLVLMDIKLKGDQDGIDAATQLRERSEVPVIFVTAFTDERTLDRAKRASPYGYIVKPFHERELRIAIELALYKHQYEISIRRARDIAEEANRVKGEFLANMSHELKTPLNSVIGFSELAMSVAHDPEQSEYLAIALSSAKSLLTLINSILDFARMEAGKLIAAASQFSLDALLDECADSLAISAFSKGIEACLGRDPSIPDSLVGDSSLLRHVLLNLIDNAVKFTDSGRVRLAARLSSEPDSPGWGPTVEFEISDTGIGMPQEKIGIAFERFTQLDPSKTRRAGGTGLGLAIVAKSVELLDANITVKSEAGKGSTFTIQVPFELGAGEPEEVIEGGRPEIGLLGFEGVRLGDTEQVLYRLGYSARAVDSLEEAADTCCRFIVADERVLEGIEDRDIASSAPGLIIATRLGGASRARLGRIAGIAFAPLPLRASSLKIALSSLSAAGVNLGSTSDGGSEQKPKTIAASPERPKVQEIDRAREGNYLSMLANTLERAVEAGSFAEAERDAKEAQNALANKGDGNGARLAFAALLSARKRDVIGLKANIDRIYAAEEKNLDSRD